MKRIAFQDGAESASVSCKWEPNISPDRERSGQRRDGAALGAGQDGVYAVRQGRHA
jgi:hypothetical protein